jgi:glyoxylate/hydroxypyruvate reductase A
MTVLYVGDAERGKRWAELHAAEAPDIPFRIWPDLGEAARITYLLTWRLPEELAGQLTRRLPNLRALFSMGAGVDQLNLATIPASIPVIRMVEPGIVEGMASYITMAVLALHRDLVGYIADQRARRWAPIKPRPASDRRIGIMGLGVIGAAAIEALRPFGFQLHGWSRSAKRFPGVTCHAGAEALPAFLASSDILVCVLPLTDATRGILDARLFAQLPRGAGLINAGRGGHLVESDLIPALDDGRLSAAALDVFSAEPLGADHPFWTHPRILMTPHVGASTQATTAASVLIANIRRLERGEMPASLVDRQRGY